MTKQRIHILSPILSNQIAAGEVVERPASIIKELIENSIDAKATEIEIRVEEGGMQAIILSDNGEGILKEDLPLSIMPHATSKIECLDDLENLQSLGFRGEALASIAAVSRFSLKSRQLETEQAWQIEMEGQGGVPEIKPTALLAGTKIEVRDLFFNVPARRKFLKASATEFSHLDEVIRRLALSHPEISFKVMHNHKQVYHVVAGDPHQRLTVLCGKDFAAQCQFIQIEKMGMSLEGWLTQPKFLKRSAGIQYFYVNGRPIRDKLMIHALKEAYRDVQYGDNQPQYVLFLEIDPRLVDFNVHPQKREVRFREGRLIHDFVRSEVKKALAETKPPLSRGATREEVSIIPQSLRDSSLIKGANLIAPFNKGGAPNGAGEFSFAPLLREPLRFGNPICQLKGLFILAESPEGLIIIDMHAAHERVLYERLKQNWHEKKWESQLLLFPQPIELSKHEEATFKEHQTEIAQMGFGIDAWMDHKIMLREVPVALAKANLEQFIHDLLQDLSLLGAANTPEIYLDQILAEVACHSAIQAHQTLSMIEMMQLLKDMENTPNIDYCNHGRPTWRLFKTEEMNRLFLRGR